MNPSNPSKESEHIFRPVPSSTAMKCSCGKVFATTGEQQQHLSWHLALASIQASHQQAVKAAQLEILERISSELDELHQGTPGAGWVHYGEIGEYIDGLIKDLSK